MAEDNDKDWTRRPDAETVIEYCVRQFHPHLERATIWALGRPKPAKKHGRDVWASLKKATPAERAIAECADETAPDYIVVVALEVWDRIPKETRIALIDHELCHAGGMNFETGEWTTVGHDLEEFSAVIQRHGGWRADVYRFIELAQTIKLPQMTLGEAFDDHVRTMKEQGVDVTVTTGGGSATGGTNG